MPQHDYCSYCGQAFASATGVQRRCVCCGQTTYLNPVPVAAVLLPVDDGLLVVRRAIAPKIGELTFPGGYVQADESWQAAAVRELYEETGLVISDPLELQVFEVLSTRRGHLVNIFGLARPRRRADLPEFRPTAEASEWLVIDEPCAMAFEQDALVAEKFFARRERRG